MIKSVTAAIFFGLVEDPFWEGFWVGLMFAYIPSMAAASWLISRLFNKNGNGNNGDHEK